MNLTAKEICSIIKVCSDAHVTHFECKDVKVIFSAKPIADKISTVVAQQTETDSSIQHPVVFTDEKNPERDNQQDAIDELMISDPTQFEELVARGELVDEPKEKEND